MDDPRNLAVEIRRLRETIELFSCLIDRFEKLSDKIERKTKALEVVKSNHLDTFDYFHCDRKNLRSVIKAVAMQWNVTPSQIISQRRTQRLIYPRFAFCHIAHKVMSYSSSKVGLALTTATTLQFCTLAVARKICCKTTSNLRPITTLFALLSKHVQHQRRRNSTDDLHSN